MYLVIDDLKVENRHLMGVILSIMPKAIMFKGMAIEDEGKRICGKLAELEKGQVVEVKAELENYRLWEGICRVAGIEVQIPEVESPKAKELIYRFSGTLDLVT